MRAVSPAVRMKSEGVPMSEVMLEPLLSTSWLLENQARETKAKVLAQMASRQTTVTQSCRRI